MKRYAIYVNGSSTPLRYIMALNRKDAIMRFEIARWKVEPFRVARVS